MFFRKKERNLPVNPFKGIIADDEYQRLRNYQRFKDGMTKVFDDRFVFSDNIGFLHSLEEIFIEEVYRFNHHNEEPYVIDAGSNVGLSLLYFNKLFPSSKITAFEPDPAIFKILQTNVETLRLKNTEIRNSAVWIEDTELEFFSEGSLAGSTEVDFIGMNQVYKVKAERLKDWLSKSYVDFLKIDIEGAENTLIFDLESDLKNVSNLFIEYHSIATKDQMLGEILNVVKKSGFRYYIKSATNSKNLPFINKTKDGFDLQLNIFCYRDQ